MSLKLKQVFVRAFGIMPDEVTDELTFGGIPEWNSMGHMALVAELEETYGIAIQPDDIVSINSFSAVQLVLKRYEVMLDVAEDSTIGLRK